MGTAGFGWIVLAIAAAAGVAAMVRTRWLQSHTLAKCVALSVVLHAVLAVVCAFVGGWSPASWGRNDEGRMTMLVALAEEPVSDEALTAATEAPGLADASIAMPAVPAVPAAVEASEVPAEGDAAPAATASLVPLLPSGIESAAAPDDHVPLLDLAEEDVASAADTAPAAGKAEAAGVADAPRATTDHRVPAAYADRFGDRRVAAAAARGGSQETERAVKAALEWLAAAQSPDGRWNAAQHGGGVERSVDGHHRHGAGARSDHGVTGLALLAFLGAGNTHRQGSHAGSVERGIRFLVERQRADGSLSGDAEFFAALYCHGMATIALAECCAMTGDLALRPSLDRAVAHTLALQHPQTGGWRYAAGDRGDTSQCGWQVMVLSSGRSAGLTGFDAAEAGARRYLQSVASGVAGGLAAYRPGERPSVAMTAEALFCRLVLGLPAGQPSTAEALALITAAPPSAPTANAYTWYYATLACFHAGGPSWDRWNAQLQAVLLPMQRRDEGPLVGSWDPDPVWGGHGGRVYSTALSAMTLEVYYRHLPMHQREQRLAARPSSAAAP
jgi:hypothetical protein